MIQDIEPRKFRIEYEAACCDNCDTLLCYMQGAVLAAIDVSGALKLPRVDELSKQTSNFDIRYLFSIDDTRFFTAVEYEPEPFGDYTLVPVRELRSMTPGYLAYAAAVGSQIEGWYAKNRFCGRCGSDMIHRHSERALKCSGCGNILYPQICPSVIVAVTNGNKLLLTRYQSAHSVYRNWALVAGYVETGETAEDTVRREVMEEVGLRVKNIKYYKSQPWPFSGALLLGFFCELDGGDELILDESELSEAVWFERGDIPERSNDVSLTSEMMECFRLSKIYNT